MNQRHQALFAILVSIACSFGKQKEATCAGNLVHPAYVRKGGRAFLGWGPASRLFWLSLTHGLKWNTIEKVAVPAKIRQVGPILVQVQSKMGQVRRFWCAVPDVFGFLVCGQMREMAAFRGIKLARMSYLAPTTVASLLNSANE